MHRSKSPRQIIRRTKGSALITVTLIGLFVMLLAAALVNHFATAEARAIAHSLAKTRIYWASMGHINYSLSRIRRQGLCGGACVNDDDGTPEPDSLANRADNLRTYLAELNDWSWDFGGGYSFNVTASVTDGPSPTPDPNDGRVRATISLAPITGSAFDTLNGIEQRIRDQLVVDICLAAPCGAPNGSSSGANRIEALRRQ
jgi:hypothetical protein